MSIATIVTRGYGAFGSIALVVTRGYATGEAIPDIGHGGSDNGGGRPVTQPRRKQVLSPKSRRRQQERPPEPVQVPQRQPTRAEIEAATQRMLAAYQQQFSVEPTIPVIDRQAIADLLMMEEQARLEQEELEILLLAAA